METCITLVAVTNQLLLKPLVTNQLLTLVVLQWTSMEFCMGAAAAVLWSDTQCGQHQQRARRFADPCAHLHVGSPEIPACCKCRTCQPYALASMAQPNVRGE